MGELSGKHRMVSGDTGNGKKLALFQLLMHHLHELPAFSKKGQEQPSTDDHLFQENHSVQQLQFDLSDVVTLGSLVRIYVRLWIVKNLNRIFKNRTADRVNIKTVDKIYDEVRYHFAGIKFIDIAELFLKIEALCEDIFFFTPFPDNEPPKDLEIWISHCTEKQFLSDKSAFASELTNKKPVEEILDVLSAITYQFETGTTFKSENNHPSVYMVSCYEPDWRAGRLVFNLIPRENNGSLTDIKKIFHSDWWLERPVTSIITEGLMLADLGTSPLQIGVHIRGVKFLGRRHRHQILKYKANIDKKKIDTTIGPVNRITTSHYTILVDKQGRLALPDIVDNGSFDSVADESGHAGINEHWYGQKRNFKRSKLSQNNPDHRHPDAFYELWRVSKKDRSGIPADNIWRKTITREKYKLHDKGIFKLRDQDYTLNIGKKQCSGGRCLSALALDDDYLKADQSIMFILLKHREFGPELGGMFELGDVGAPAFGGIAHERADVFCDYKNRANLLQYSYNRQGSGFCRSRSSLKKMSNSLGFFKHNTSMARVFFRSVSINKSYWTRDSGYNDADLQNKAWFAGEVVAITPRHHFEHKIDIL